jgi:hypothetical protein
LPDNLVSRFPDVKTLFSSLVPILGIAGNSLGADANLPLQFRKIVLEGETLPGASEALTGFELPLINENGEVAFIGFSAGSSGVWKEAGRTLTLVVQERDPAPGTNNDIFEDFEDLNFNDAGASAFVASLANSPSGIWQERAAGVRKVVARGDLSPFVGEPAERYFDRPFSTDVSGIFPFVLNNSSVVAFYSELRLEDTTIAGEGVFRNVNGVLEAVHFTRFPGVSSGLIDVSNDNTLADNGAVAAILRDSASQFVAGGPAQDDPAPNTGGAKLLSFTPPAINAVGEMAFRGTLASTPGATVTTSDDTAIYSTAGGLHLVARENSPAPGTSAVFNDLSTFPVINDNGDVVFEASLRGAPADRNWGIWTTVGGALRPLVLSGDPVPRAAAGTTFRFSTTLPTKSMLVLNGRGNVAFVAQMEGNTVSAANDIALVAEIQGELVVLLREGDAFEVAPGDPRVIHSFQGNSEFGIAGGTGNGDGRRSAFNNKNQLVFAAQFTDGSSGIFVIEDLELPVARRDLQPKLSVTPEGYPSIAYQPIPGLEYSIERRSSITEVGIEVAPPVAPNNRVPRTYTDTSVQLIPDNFPVFPRGFYMIRYTRVP